MENFTKEKIQSLITEVIDRLDILRDNLSNKGEELSKDDKAILRMVFTQTEVKRILSDIKIGFLTGDLYYMENAFFDLGHINKELS